MNITDLIIILNKLPDLPEGLNTTDFNLKEKTKQKHLKYLNFECQNAKTAYSLSLAAQHAQYAHCVVRKQGHTFPL